MEPLVSSIHWVLNWDRIPWNLSFQILIKIMFNCAGWINFRKLINTLHLFASLFHQLIFYLHYTICISGITHYVSKYHSKSLFNAHWNLFWSKCSMELSLEFHGTFWTTFEQHLWFHGIPWNLSNKTSSSMEFHGIPWNFDHIQSSMEFHGTISILPSSMEFHVIPRNFKFSKKSSMEFDGIPWNLINFIFKKIIFLNIVFVIWLMINVIWLETHRSATYCIVFNIVIRILNTPVSAKMAQGQQKWRAVQIIYCPFRSSTVSDHAKTVSTSVKKRYIYKYFHRGNDLYRRFYYFG